MLAISQKYGALAPQAPPIYTLVVQSWINCSLWDQYHRTCPWRVELPLLLLSFLSSPAIGSRWLLDGIVSIASLLHNVCTSQLGIILRKQHRNLLDDTLHFCVDYGI